MTSMTVLIEKARTHKQAQQAESVERRTHAEWVVEASKAADLADLRALLGEEMAGEMEIALVSHDVNWDGHAYNTRYRLRPQAWNGLVYFDIFHIKRENPWRFIYMDQYLRDDYFDARAEPSQVWADTRVLHMLAYLQEQYEKERDERVKELRGRLADARDAAAVINTLADLMALAPERVDEWDALAADVSEHINARAAAVDTYVAALGAWRAEYESTLAANRAAVAEMQGCFDDAFDRSEIAYVAAGLAANDELSAYRETAWVLGDGPDAHDYWRVFEGGSVALRRIPGLLWVSEPITQTVTEAGPGPWRAFVYAYEAGQSVYCLPYSVAQVRDWLALRLKALPEEPSPEHFGLDGEWTAEERGRINEATRGMAHVEIPF